MTLPPNFCLDTPSENIGNAVMEDVTEASMKVLATYREMIQDPSRCDVLCKDMECLLFLVYMLKDQDDELIAEALQILLMICENPFHHSTVSGIFGIVPSLNLLISSSQNREIKISARKLRRLVSSQMQSEDATLMATSSLLAPLEENRSKAQSRPHFLGAANAKAKTIVLKICGLESKAQRHLCEDELINVKGVISITFDLKKGYCIVRARCNLKIELLAEAIKKTKTMTAQEVVTNECGEEVFVPLCPGGETDHKENEPLPYLPELDSPVKENAVVHFRDLKRTTVKFLATAADFLSRSFYW